MSKRYFDGVSVWVVYFFGRCISLGGVFVAIDNINMFFFVLRDRFVSRMRSVTLVRRHAVWFVVFARHHLLPTSSSRVVCFIIIIMQTRPWDW